MANLSRDRMNKEALFLFCSVDMFGPLVMKSLAMWKNMVENGSTEIETLYVKVT